MITNEPNLDYIKTFSIKLKEQIHEKQFTLMDIEDICGCTSANIYNWINGKLYPSTPSIYNMAVLLNCSADWLLGLSYNKNLKSTNTDYTVLGTRLKLLMYNKNISCIELASMCKVNVNTISKWRLGRKFPSLIHLIDLAKSLETTVDYFIGLED